MKREIVMLIGIMLGVIMLSKETSAWETLKTLNDSSTAKNLTFTTSENKTVWIQLPKNIRVINAKLNLSGYYKGGSGSLNNLSISPYSYDGWYINNLSSSICTSNDVRIDTGSRIEAQAQDVAFLFNASTINNDKNTFNKIYGKILGIANNESSGILEINAFSSVTGMNCPRTGGTNWAQGLSYSGEVWSIYSQFNIETYTYWTFTDSGIPARDIYWVRFGGNSRLELGKYVPSYSRVTWDGSTYFKVEYYNESYSSNSYLDVGSDGDTEWSYTGEYNETVSPERTANFSQEINAYLSTCSEDLCDVPLVLHSDTAGKIQIDDINITYGSPKWTQNLSSDSVSLTNFNITWEDDSPYYIDTVFIESNHSGTPTNYTATLISGSTISGVWNYNNTISTEMVVNWTSYANASDGIWNSTPYWIISIDRTKPTIHSFELNDTYININETVKLRVNVTNGLDKVIAEVQKPSGNTNLTMSLDGTGNYTLLLNKTNLGEVQTDLSEYINITKIYANDTTGNMQVNSTTLNFSYATTELYGIGESEDPITNEPGKVQTIYAKWNQTDNTRLTGGSCTILLAATTYTLTYDSTNDRYEVDISMSGWAQGVYNYNVNCSNSSYQNASGTGSFEVIAGGAPGPGGGGGAVTYIITTPEGEKVVCGNLICEEGETYMNCPMDCKPVMAVTPIVQIEFLIIIGSLLGLGYYYSATKKKKRVRR